MMSVPDLRPARDLHKLRIELDKARNQRDALLAMLKDCMREHHTLHEAREIGLSARKLIAECEGTPS